MEEKDVMEEQAKSGLTAEEHTPTVEAARKKLAEMEYEDGAATLFLYTKGTKGVPNEGLKQLLHYMEEKYKMKQSFIYENAVNDDLREVRRMVEMLKKDSETTICCVRLMEKLERSKKEGEAIGEARGKAEGNLQRLVTQICKKMKLGQSLEKIAEDLVEEVSVIEPIYNMAGKYEPEYDTELVMKELAAAGQKQEKSKVIELL